MPTATDEEPVDATIVEPDPDAEGDAELADIDEPGDDAAIVGELVDSTEIAVAEPVSAAHAAIEAAARAAMETPGIAGRDEFLVLAMQARIMASSALVPKALQGKPHDVMIVLLTGRDLGIPTTAALRKVYVIDGQPSIAPQLKLALVRRQGLGMVRKVRGSCAGWAAALAFGPDGEQISDEPVVVTWRDVAGDLVGLDCWPAGDGQSIEHSEKCLSRAKGSDAWRGGARVVCKDNWRNYPRRMLWWRAAGYCADDDFPEVGLGLYSPDELGSVTDADGKPLDPATVELPPGFEEPQTVAGREAAATAAAGAPGSAEDLAELQLRVDALPDEQRAAMRERWLQTERLKGFSLSTLPAGHVAFVRSMVNGYEAMAARQVDGWDPATARQAVLDARAASSDPAPAAQEPATGPDADPAPDADAAPESATAPDSGDVAGDQSEVGEPEAGDDPA